MPVVVVVVVVVTVVVVERSYTPLLSALVKFRLTALLSDAILNE